MNSVIAVKTRSNMELKAKKMILWFQKQKGIDQIKDVHALETFTEVIDEHTEKVTSTLTNKDIEQNELRKELGSEVTNLKKQLDVTECLNKRGELRANIKDLEQQKNKIRKKKIESVVKGYVLIELKEGIYELSNDIYALINNVPVVQYVLSQLPILQEEISSFFNTIKEELEPQVEFEVNNPKSMIERFREIAKQKVNNVKNRFFSAYTNKKSVVKMPLKIFKVIYLSSGSTNNNGFSFTNFINECIKESIKKESIIHGREGL